MFSVFQLKQKTSFNPKTAFLVFSLMIAFLIVIANLNKVILLPQTTLKIEHAVAVEGGDEGMVIIDNEYDRILFVDAEGRLVNVLHLGGSGVPLDEAELVKIKDGRVLVAGYKCYDSSWYYKSEAIVEYDMAGNLVKKLYSYEFPAEDTVSYPTISKIDILRDGALKVEALRGKYLTTRIISPGQEASMQKVEAADSLCRYYPLRGSSDALVKSNSGIWYLFSTSVTEIVPVSEQTARQCWLGNYQLTPAEAEIIFDRGIFPKNNMLSRIVDRETGHKQLLHINYDNNLARYDYEDKTDTVIKELPFSWGLLLRTISFWLAAIYLSLIVLWQLGMILYRLHSGAAVLLVSGYLKTALSMLFVAALITGFYTKVTYDHYWQESKQITAFQLRQVEDMLRYNYKDVLDGIAEHGKKWYAEPQNQERLIALQDQLRRFVYVCGKNSSYYVSIIFTDTQGKDFYTLVDTTSWTTTGEPNQEARLPDEEHKEGVISDEILNFNNYINGIKCFRTDNGRVFAVLETGCLTTNVLAKQQKEALNNFFSLLAILIGLYLVKLCIQSFLGRYYLFRQEWQRDPGNAKGHLSGILNFLYGTAMDLDAVLCVFVVREMMPDASLAELAAYSALPPTFFALGDVVFNVLFSRPFYRRFSERYASVIGGLLSIFSFSLMIIAVNTKNINLFLGSKVLAGIGFCSFVYYLVMLSSMGIKDEKLRFESNYEGMRFRGVSNVMTMLGGVYIAESFGYSTIYIIACIASAVISVILFFISSDKVLLQEKPESEAVREKTGGGLFGFKSFFLTLPGIMVIGTLFVASQLIRVYDSYFFPLCSTELSLTPIVITNCCVFAKVANIVLSDFVQSTKKKMSLWSNNIMFLSFNAILLAFFQLSPSLIWALLVLMLVSANYSMADVYSYVSALSLKNGFAPAKMVMDFGLVISIVLVLRGFFLSALSVFHIYQATALTGGLCLLLTLGYAWYSRKEKI